MYIVTGRVTYTDIDSDIGSYIHSIDGDMVHTYIVYVVVIDRQFAQCIIQYSVFIDLVCYYYLYFLIKLYRPTKVYRLTTKEIFSGLCVS